jgi:uncharacterized protein
METSTMATRVDLGIGHLGIRRLLLFVFVPTTLLTLVYVLVGPLVQEAIPSLLLFFLLAALILFPIQLWVILSASKKGYGRYSLESAFYDHQELSWWKIALYGSLLWGLAGILSVTIAPLEAMLFSPITERLSQIVPAYFDWTTTDYLQQYSRNVLVLTAVMYFLMNGLAGPIVEELFFRGYLTAGIRRYGIYAPILVTVLFSLYHFWLPFSNVFRIMAFYPAAYLAWKKKNIYIAIVFHCLSNLVSVISFIAAVNALL